MPLQLVQTQPIGAGTLTLASPVTTNAAISTQTGNLLVIAFRGGSGATITSISDPGGNTWIPLTLINPFGVTGQMFYAKNINGWIAGNITVNFSPTPANNPFGIVWEIAGADTVNPFDAQVTSSGTGPSTTVSSSTPLVTNFANEIVLSFCITNGSNSPYVPPTGETLDNASLPTTGANLQLGAAAHAIVSSKQSSVLTWSWTINLGTTGSCMVAASFVAAAAPVLVQLATDNFFRGDGGLGPNWTTMSTMSANQIVGHVVEGTVLNTNCSSVYTGAAFPPDQYVQGVVGSVLASSFAGVFGRASVAAGTGHFFYIVGPEGANAATLTLNGLDSYTVGAATKLLTVNSGDVLLLTCIGNIISGYVNGFLRVQGPKAVPLVGSPAIYARGLSTNADGQMLPTWSAGAAYNPTSGGGGGDEGPGYDFTFRL